MEGWVDIRLRRLGVVVWINKKKIVWELHVFTMIYFVKGLFSGLILSNCSVYTQSHTHKKKYPLYFIYSRTYKTDCLDNI